jgi:hypothetical protein
MGNVVMYLFGDYFIECIPEALHGDCWTASARISRRVDYRRFGPVHKVEYPTDIKELSRIEAEHAGVEWAKILIVEHGREVEDLICRGVLLAT